MGKRNSWCAGDENHLQNKKIQLFCGKVKAMINRILVPVDFSENAKNAFEYAQQFIELLPDAQLKVVHAFMPNAESEYPNFVPPVADYLKIREQMLRDFMLEVDPEGKIENEILIGFPADELVTQSKDMGLIIMGTTGKGGIINKVFGSVSSTVARRAHCPVLLIPKGYTFKDTKHVLYASNYESADNDLLQTLIEFNRLLKATVHFVHVREEESQFDKTKEEIFEELFEKGEPDFCFHIAEIDAESVAEGLNDYAFSHGVGMVVMAHRQRKFWERFFHKSQTKQVAMASQLPLLVLQSED